MEIKTLSKKKYNEKIKKIKFKIWHYWKLAYSSHDNNNMNNSIKKSLKFMGLMMIGEIKMAFLKFVSIFKIEHYEIYDLIFKRNIKPDFESTEQEEFDYSKLPCEESIVSVIKNMKDKSFFNFEVTKNKEDNEYFALCSKKNRYFIILKTSAKIKNGLFSIFEKEIFGFFHYMLEEFRKKHFETISNEFLKEITKTQQIDEIFSSISKLLYILFNENVSYQISIDYSENNLISINKEKKTNKYSHDFSKEGCFYFIYFKTNIFLEIFAIKFEIDQFKCEIGLELFHCFQDFKQIKQELMKILSKLITN